MLVFVNYFLGCSVHQSLVLQYGHTNKYSLPECSVITTFDHLMLNSLEQCLHLKECDAMRFANITTIATATIGISTANKYSINLLPPSNSYFSNRLYHFSAYKSRRSLVSHQFRRNCISSTRSVASHQAAGGFMHGYAVMIYHRKAMDDIQPRWG